VQQDIHKPRLLSTPSDKEIKEGYKMQLGMPKVKKMH
jgi:hypothetical protein